MKHSLLALTFIYVLLISHTTTTMPSKTTMTGIACLTGAGILAAKHAKNNPGNIVSGTKIMCNAIKNGTLNTAKNIKHWYENDRYSDLKISLGLATTGGIIFIPYKKEIVVPVVLAAPFVYYTIMDILGMNKKLAGVKRILNFISRN